MQSLLDEGGFFSADSTEEHVAVFGGQRPIAWVTQFLSGQHAVLIQLEGVGLQGNVLVDAMEILLESMKGMSERVTVRHALTTSPLMNGV